MTKIQSSSSKLQSLVFVYFFVQFTSLQSSVPWTYNGYSREFRFGQRFALIGMYFLWRKLQACDMLSQCLFSEEKISSPLMHSHQTPEFSVLIGYCSVDSLRSIGFHSLYLAIQLCIYLSKTLCRELGMMRPHQEFFNESYLSIYLSIQLSIYLSICLRLFTGSWEC